MNFKVNRIILLLLGIIILLFPILGDLRKYGMPGSWDYALKYYLTYFCLISAFCIYHRLVWKCPHCGKNPGYKIVERCPHCNEPLDN